MLEVSDSMPFHAAKVVIIPILWLLAVRGLLMPSAASAAERNAAPAPSPYPIVTDARVGGDENQTRFIADISRKVELRVFTLADRLSGNPVARAVVPQIPLHSPKITRSLTSDWFANRVEARYRTCLGRMRT